MSSVQVSCSRYQPRGVLRGLLWRVARRRSGSRMVVSVRGRCSWSGGAGLGGLLCPARPCGRMVCPGWAPPGWAVRGGFVGERGALGCFGG